MADEVTESRSRLGIFGQEGENMQSMSQSLDKGTKELLDVLDNCVQVCNNCTAKDLMEPDLSEMVKCIQLDLDCSDICTMVSHFVSRGSEFSSDLLGQCAIVCDTCAGECEKHPDMPHCVECAVACRRCAEECRKFRTK